MNKDILKLLSVCLICFVSFVSCERYPMSALLGIPDTIASWPNPWYVYDDEINTKGLLAPYRWKDDLSCADWDKVRLNFACSDGAKVGNKCISFSWVGNNGDPGKYFFGFGMQAREELGGRIKLGAGGYKKAEFWLKGNLYSGCDFEIGIPDPDNPGKMYPHAKCVIKASDVKPDWQLFDFRMDGIGPEDEVEFVLSVSLKAAKEDGNITNGGTIYIDDIRFIKE